MLVACDDVMAAITGTPSRRMMAVRRIFSAASHDALSPRLDSAGGKKSVGPRGAEPAGLRRVTKAASGCVCVCVCVCVFVCVCGWVGG